MRIRYKSPNLSNNLNTRYCAAFQNLYINLNNKLYSQFDV